MCQKKRKDVEYTLLKEFFPKIFCFTWAVDCRKFVQYIYMLCPGRFILVESVTSAGDSHDKWRFFWYVWSKMAQNLISQGASKTDFGEHKQPISTSNVWMRIAEVATFYASFGTFLCPNWSIIRVTVSLWRMLEHRQIIVFHWKCHWFQILSKVQRLTAARIIDQFGQKVPKEV